MLFYRMIITFVKSEVKCKTQSNVEHFTLIILRYSQLIPSTSFRFHGV